MTPTPISDAKLEANRNNAQKSSGPRTEAGKRVASHNALRHGFTGRVNILTPANREAHDNFCNDLIESLNPETPMERQFAHSIAEDSWRINGLRAAEANLLAEATAWSLSESEVAVRTARAYVRNAKELQLMSLYEQRINRAIHKNLAQLQTLQAERQTLREQALEEARLLASVRQPAKPDPTKPQPTTEARGFVFSSDEIDSATLRHNGLKKARKLAATPLTCAA